MAFIDRLKQRKTKVVLPLNIVIIKALLIYSAGQPSQISTVIFVRVVENMSTLCLRFPRNFSWVLFLG